VTARVSTQSDGQASGPHFQLCPRRPPGGFEISFTLPFKRADVWAELTRFSNPLGASRGVTYSRSSDRCFPPWPVACEIALSGGGMRAALHLPIPLLVALSDTPRTPFTLLSSSIGGSGDELVVGMLRRAEFKSDHFKVRGKARGGLCI
jgi:hypothetical protein